MSSNQVRLSPLFNVILIRYGEIALKSQQVRKRLLRSLMRNIKFQCKRDHVKFSRLWRDHGFVYLHPENGYMESAISSLQTVLGVHSISPAIFAQGGFEEIQETALKLADEFLTQNNSFGVRVRRIGQHSFSSNEIAKTVGSQIMKEFGDSRNLSVNLSQPDKWIHINVRDNNIFVYSESIETPWGGNPIETFSGGSVLLSRGLISEFVSAMLLMKRGVYILPLVYAYDAVKTEKIHTVFTQFKQYLPVRSFYYFRIEMKEVQTRIQELTIRYQYPPLEYFLTRKFQILLGTWVVKNHEKLFELLESKERIDWSSNIASYLSSKQQKSQRSGLRRKLIEYLSVVEGNYPFVYYPSNFPVLKDIESSSIPIFRAAVSFTQSEINEKFKKISASNEKLFDFFSDYPELDNNTEANRKLLPFPLKSIINVPEKIVTNFDEIWFSLCQEIELILKDHGLYGEPTLRSIESLELIQI